MYRGCKHNVSTSKTCLLRRPVSVRILSLFRIFLRLFAARKKEIRRKTGHFTAVNHVDIARINNRDLKQQTFLRSRTARIKVVRGLDRHQHLWRQMRRLSRGFSRTRHLGSVGCVYVLSSKMSTLKETRDVALLSHSQVLITNEELLHFSLK